MNLEIYLVILILSIIFIVLGYMLKDNADIFKIIGFGFLFILSVIIIPGTPGSLEYQTGTEITETVDGYTTEDIMTEYENFTFGFFMSLAGIFGFINVYATRKKSSWSDDQ